MEVSFALKTAIELAQNGNKSSFEFIYLESFSFAWHRANLITKYNVDASSDIVQDAYVICYQQIHTLENIDSFFSWLASIIYHLGMKFYRNQKKEYLINDTECDWDFTFSVSNDIDTPDSIAQEKAKKAIIRDLIETLPEIQKITLIAHYYDGLKVEQIAKAMDCPESTVKSRLNYARLSLKSAIERTEKRYGYRIHSISFSLLYTTIKELLADSACNDISERSLYKEFLLRLHRTSTHTEEYSVNNDNPSDIGNEYLANRNYTAAISAVLDSVPHITTSLGMSAVLTAPLLDQLDADVLNNIDLFHIDFTSLITSIKTKFALASAATAIGSPDVLPLQNIDIQDNTPYEVESILTSSLSMYDHFLCSTCELSDIKHIFNSYFKE